MTFVGITFNRLGFDMRTLLISFLLAFAGSAIAAPIASVGNEAIDSSAVSYRLSTERAYGNSRMTDAVALVSLINDAIELETAASLGIAPTETEISDLANHAQQTTKAPAILAKVKAIFGNDLGAYNRLYISPKVVNRKLREHHSNTAEIHQAEKAVADNVLSLASSGKTFEEIADETTATVSSFDVPVNSDSSLTSILSALSVDSFHPGVIEDDSSYMVVRLTAKDSEKFTVEALRIQKKSFDEWFRGIANGISIQIQNQQLRQSIQSNYSGIWWTSNL